MILLLSKKNGNIYNSFKSQKHNQTNADNVNILFCVAADANGIVLWLPKPLTKQIIFVKVFIHFLKNVDPDLFMQASCLKSDNYRYLLKTFLLLHKYSL